MLDILRFPQSSASLGAVSRSTLLGRFVALPPGETVGLHATPSADAEVLARLSHDADCLRNLGCRGGLSLVEFQNLSEAERAARLEENPRWCKVERDGAEGWIRGDLLAESSCTPASTSPAGNQEVPVVDEDALAGRLTPDETLEEIELTIIGETQIDGTIEGYATKVYAIPLVQRQRLTVTMTSGHTQAYFNVIDAADESGAAVFAGMTDNSQHAQIDAPAATVYLIRPFLARAAGRRDEKACYQLTIRRE